MKNYLPLICLLCFLGVFPQTARSQAPNLGTVSNFAVFTSVGAFNSLGNTLIEGDIGTDNGGITGFPPGYINGSAFAADPTTAQAKIDLMQAYNFLVAQTCDTAIGVLLGNGQVFSPRIYCIGAASTLNGELILDGKGNPNAIFIFQITGAFSADSLSQIILIDSAKWCNVYWQINGAVSLGPNSIFRGTVLNNGAITMLDSANLIGRILTMAGAVNLHQATATNNCARLIPLPLELNTFSIHCIKQNISLDWQAEEETQAYKFDVQSSADGRNWKIIHTIALHSNKSVNYNFIDLNSVYTPRFYRIKQSNFNNTFSYSQPLKNPDCSANSGILNLFPNPTSGHLYIQLNPQSEVLKTRVYNSQGNLIMVFIALPTFIDMQQNAAGCYVLCIQTSTQIYHKIFMVTD